jgi:hypothetical protein
MVMTEPFVQTAPLPFPPVYGDSLDAFGQSFSTPREVLESEDLSVAEKRRILSHWASDACAVESAPAWRQPPGAAAPVAYEEIRRALYRLDGLDEAEPVRFDGRTAFRPPAAEPPVEEMLADPIVRMLMARDGVSEHDVRAALRAARNRRAGVHAV